MPTLIKQIPFFKRRKQENMSSFTIKKAEKMLKSILKRFNIAATGIATSNGAEGDTSIIVFLKHQDYNNKAMNTIIPDEIRGIKIERRQALDLEFL